MGKQPLIVRRTVLALLVLALGITCYYIPPEDEKEDEQTAGTGGAGGMPSEQEGGMPSEQVHEPPSLEVLALNVRGEGRGEAAGTSFVTLDTIAARSRVRNAEELNGQMQWHLQPVAPNTADADSTAHEGPEALFQGSSHAGTMGSRAPNPPLEYDLVVSLPLEDGKVLQVRLPSTTFLRQDEADVLRQEYIDYGTRFQPGRAQVSIPDRRTLNTGNYAVIAEEEAGELSRLLDLMDERIRALLNNDVQEQRVGAHGLRPDTVVVSSGEAILTAGPLGDTDPEGDDVCASPLVGRRCAGPILAGPNGIADTRANNREVPVKLEDFVSSAFRNPQRNRAAGSVTINSRHTRGLALDIDPRRMRVPGKTARQLMCIVEAAGDAIVGERNSFTERGAALFLACDSPMADHVHVQR